MLRVLALLAAAAIVPAGAAVETVCTITVNSADEREAFRRHLPGERFAFVELVERGRRDWLQAACRRQVRCDILLVSGHFAGTEFYSSRHDANESLEVDEIERVQCSGGCPALFGRLKEVYLFGCDSLKAEAVRDHAEASREVMRRLFADVPVIYGFSSLAPYGRVAGPMLERFFAAGIDEVGSGAPSPRLLRLFGPASMVATRGLPGLYGPGAARPASCRFLDDRIALAAKVAAAGELLGGEPEGVHRGLERVEMLLDGIGDAQRAEPDLASAFAALAANHAARDRYLALTRATTDPLRRVRMIGLAGRVGWLDADARHAETGRMLAELLAAGAVGYGEVDLACRLNGDRALDAHLALLERTGTARVSHAAARACLGSAASRAVVLQALASRDEAEVAVAQAYLRHRPVEDVEELRALAAAVARMPPSDAQVRALETLARHHVSDAVVLDQLARLFARSDSLAVQRAIAEVFVRSGRPPEAATEWAQVLRRHRQRAPGGEDLIDAAIRRLESS